MAIFSLGISGVLVSYMNLLNGMRLGQEALCAAHLAKEVMLKAEEESLGAAALAQGAQTGFFSAPYQDYIWQREVAASGEAGLDKVEVAVFNLRRPERKFSLVTYAKSKKQD